MYFSKEKGMKETPHTHLRARYITRKNDFAFRFSLFSQFTYSLSKPFFRACGSSHIEPLPCIFSNHFVFNSQGKRFSTFTKGQNCHHHLRLPHIRLNIFIMI